MSKLTCDARFQETYNYSAINLLRQASCIITMSEKQENDSNTSTAITTDEHSPNTTDNTQIRDEENDTNNNENNDVKSHQNTVPRSQIALQKVFHHYASKAKKRGLEFTLIVVGESGLGKSTLINCLFAYEIKRESVEARKLMNRTVSIDRHCLEIQEKGVKLRLTLIDTPGYGDAIDCEKSFLAVESYIEDQFKKYFKDECGFNRTNISDTRVDCCLYMISSSGKGLSCLDKEFMLRLHNKVNIVPCIAKADALTEFELKSLKKNILNEIQQLGINIFIPPLNDKEEEKDPYSSTTNYTNDYKAIEQSLPFAIVSSMVAYEIDGRVIQGRLYPYGIVDIHNPIYDYDKLRLWLQDFMQDFRDKTNEVLYENYRASLLSKLTNHQQSDNVGNQHASSTIASVALSDQLHRNQEELKRTQAQLIHVQHKLKSLAAREHLKETT